MRRRLRRFFDGDTFKDRLLAVQAQGEIAVPMFGYKIPSAATGNTASSGASPSPMPPRTMAGSSEHCSIPTTPPAAYGRTRPTARPPTSTSWTGAA
jgi:hypothetical protein